MTINDNFKASKFPKWYCETQLCLLQPGFVIIELTCVLIFGSEKFCVLGQSVRYNQVFVRTRVLFFETWPVFGIFESIEIIAL